MSQFIEMIVYEAHEAHQRVKTLKNEINKNFLELGKELKRIRDERLYKHLDYETFESYIAQPELSFHRRGVYALVGIYEDFVESGVCTRVHIEDIEWTKLDRIRQFKNDGDFIDWIEKARTLSRSDLNEEIRVRAKATKKPGILVESRKDKLVFLRDWMDCFLNKWSPKEPFDLRSEECTGCLSIVYCRWLSDLVEEHLAWRERYATGDHKSPWPFPLNGRKFHHDPQTMASEILQALLGRSDERLGTHLQRPQPEVNE